MKGRKCKIVDGQTFEKAANLWPFLFETDFEEENGRKTGREIFM